MKLHRLLYREMPFAALTPAGLQRLDSAFGEMVAAHPLICYREHRADLEQWLITDFVHASMLRYRGVEFVQIERGTVS
ncbi:hypothetical protein, partial [Chryseobacterium sp. SIMBA_028]